MEKFRNLTNNIFFKIFLGFLGLTFVMFGVSGFLLGGNNAWVAKVNNKEIKYDQFIKTLQNSREAIYRANQSPDALKYLESSQFKQDVLGRIVTKKLLHLLQEEFQIYPNQDLILQEIVVNEIFKGEDGKFDRDLYQNILKSNNLTEKQHISEISSEVAGSLIMQSFMHSPALSQSFIEDIYQYRFETRKVDLITITTKNIGLVNNPDEFELNAFFEKNKNQFILPEMRKVSFVDFDVNLFKKGIVVSDEEIKEEYKNNQDQYQIPESRDFYHILLDNEKEAEKFAESLKLAIKDSDKSSLFIKLSLNKNKDESEILLKDIIKKDLPEEIADEAFSLQKAQYSKVLKSKLGFHVFYLLDINSATTIPFIEVKNQIKSKLLGIKEDKQIKDQLQAIEDDILAGVSIAGLAKRFGLSVNKNMPKFDAKGLNSVGKKVKNIDNLEGFVKNSFVLTKDQLSKIFFSKNNSHYYIISVDEIDKSRQRSLDEVRVMVTDLWVKESSLQKLQKLADNIVEKINKNKGNINLIVKNNGFQIVKNLEFSRFYAIDVGGKKMSLFWGILP